jgi:hypothetical protein
MALSESLSKFKVLTSLKAITVVSSTKAFKSFGQPAAQAITRHRHRKSLIAGFF